MGVQVDEGRSDPAVRCVHLVRARGRVDAGAHLGDHPVDDQEVADV